MKTKLIGTVIFAAAVFFLLSCTGCELLHIVDGNGNIATKSFDLKNFTAISCSGSWTVNVEQGDTFAVKVTSDENLFPFFDILVSPGILHIKVKSTYNLKSTKQEVSVTLPDLEGLYVSGSAKVFMPKCNTIGMNLTLSVSGSGKIKVENLTVGKTELKIAGSGTVSASGKAENINAFISGSGKMKAAELEANDASVDISGSGSAKVWAKNILNAVVSGSGIIYYKGSPNLTSHISGSGKIIQIP